MSDFGSLLNQFQRNTKQWAEPADNSNRKGSGRSSSSGSLSEGQSRKRPRKEYTDLSNLPPVRQVYCICPAEVQTGGPEALHQLCDQVNQHASSLKAYMVYVRSNGRRVTHVPRAQKPAAYETLYQAPVVSEPTSNPLAQQPAPQDVLLVWPECWTDELLSYANNHSTKSSSSPCAIWWLSVDNNTRKFQQWQRHDILHLYQSEYAHNYLQQHDAKHCLAMTEYISNPPVPRSLAEERTIDVLYNPLKGIHYTDAIRKRSGHVLQFRPIGGGHNGRDRISPDKVRALLQQAKIYIDFGPHPGMDRLPREAALAGCAIVTNRQGAAKYEEDVPLPAKYKLKEFDVDEVHKLLINLRENFCEWESDFHDYRTWIRSQSDIMASRVDTMFHELVTKRLGKPASVPVDNTEPVHS